jgi:hypothetical protein
VPVGRALDAIVIKSGVLIVVVSGASLFGRIRSRHAFGRFSAAGNLVAGSSAWA